MENGGFLYKRRKRKRIKILHERKQSKTLLSKYTADVNIYMCPYPRLFLKNVTVAITLYKIGTNLVLKADK